MITELIKIKIFSPVLIPKAIVVNTRHLIAEKQPNLILWRDKNIKKADFQAIVKKCGGLLVEAFWLYVVLQPRMHINL